MAPTPSSARRPYLTASLTLVFIASALASAGGTAAAVPSPIPEEFHGNNGIGPGSQLLIERGFNTGSISDLGDGATLSLPAQFSAENTARTVTTAAAAAPSHGLCTASWLWKDQDGNPYLGTAGHCVIPEVETNTSTFDYDTSKLRVYVCRSVCVFGGQSGGTAGILSAATPTAVPDAAGDWVRLGEVRYARRASPTLEQVGNDFAVIAIPPALVPDLRPAMAGWGAPAGYATTATAADKAVIHGNGVYTGETFLTRDRQGRFTDFGVASFGTSLESNGGDSGSAVGLLDGNGVLWAAGTHTHGSFSGCPIGPSQGTAVVSSCGGRGTTILRAMEMAREAGLCLELVLGSEDVTALEDAADCFAPELPEDPCPGTTSEATKCCPPTSASRAPRRECLEAGRPAK